MALTTTTLSAYTISDFQYWTGSAWKTCLNASDVQAKTYVRLKTGSTELTATITDDDAYLNDRSGSQSSEDQAYVQTLQITDPDGNIVWGGADGRIFSADSASVNHMVSTGDAGTLNPEDDTYIDGTMDTYATLTSTYWNGTTGNVVLPYILVAQGTFEEGVVYKNGASNSYATDNDAVGSTTAEVTGYDPTVNNVELAGLEATVDPVGIEPPPDPSPGPSPTPDAICFVTGTMIETEIGPKPVEQITIGDRIITKDNGIKPVRWVGKKTLANPLLRSFPRLWPVRIKKGALGQGLPREDLYLSQQHRILVKSRIAKRMFDSEEILAPALKFINLEGIDIVDELDEVTYVHFLFDQHEIIYSNGAETESLYTGENALKAIGEEARLEILELFPELADEEHIPIPARPIPPIKRIQRLANRIANKNHTIYFH